MAEGAMLSCARIPRAAYLSRSIGEMSFSARYVSAKRRVTYIDNGGQV